MLCLLYMHNRSYVLVAYFYGGYMYKYSYKVILVKLSKRYNVSARITGYLGISVSALLIRNL